MIVGLPLFVILIVSAGFYNGYFQFWWRELEDASGFLDHFSVVFGFLFISFFAVAFLGFLFAMAFMGCSALFESAQKKTGFILPYLQRRLAEENLRSKERAVAAKEIEEIRAKAKEEQKRDADICADFGRLIERHDLVSFFIDETRLPHSKEVIHSAILRQIKRFERNKENRNIYEGALICLSSFQPKVGLKPIPKDMLSMMKSEGVHMEDFSAKSEEFKKIIDEYSKRFKKIEKKVAKYQALWERETNSTPRVSKASKKV